MNVWSFGSVEIEYDECTVQVEAIIMWSFEIFGGEWNEPFIVIFPLIGTLHQSPFFDSDLWPLFALSLLKLCNIFYVAVWASAYFHIAFSTHICNFLQVSTKIFRYLLAGLLEFFWCIFSVCFLVYLFVCLIDWLIWCMLYFTNSFFGIINGIIFYIHDCHMLWQQLIYCN